MATSSDRAGNVDWDKGYINYQKNLERRIVLIGKTGAGKSSFGNEVLGMKHFDTKGAHMMSNTTVCTIGRCKTKEGKDILVLDTPGLSDTKRPKEETLEELMKCTTITAPGPHVFCLLIRCDERFTPECVASLDEYCSFFGEEIYKHLIVVFTHKNELEKDQTIDGCLRSLPKKFQERFLQYGGKAIGVEVKYVGKQKRKKQIKGFFTLMEEIIRRNNGDYYSDKMFKAVENAFKEREKKAQEKAKKELEAAKELLASERKKREQEFLEREKKLKKAQEKAKKELEAAKELLTEHKKREQEFLEREKKLEKAQEKANKELEAFKELLTSEHKKREQERLEREKNLKEERNKLERKIKSIERDTKKQITVLQEKLKEETRQREKDNEDHTKKLKDMEQASQDLCKQLIDARNLARKEVLESLSFFDIANYVVTNRLGKGVIAQLMKKIFDQFFGGGKGPNSCLCLE